MVSAVGSAVITTMVRTLFSLLLAIPLAIFALPWCWNIVVHQFTSHISAAANPYPEYPLAVGIGLALGLILMLWKKPDWLIHTTIHELCHALACLILFVRIRGFATSDGEGGKVTYDAPSDPFRDIIIGIAPYTFPLVLTIALLIHRFVPMTDPWPAIATGIASFAYLHHIHGLYHNIRINFWGSEGDLSRVGRPLSFVLIAGVLLLVSAWTIHELWSVDGSASK